MYLALIETTANGFASSVLDLCWMPFKIAALESFLRSCPSATLCSAWIGSMFPH